MNRAILGVDEEVKTLFDEYEWPGNVRELKNVLEGAFNVATSRTIKKEFLPGYMLAGTKRGLSDMAGKRVIHWDYEKDFSLEDEIKNYERNLVVSAVENSRNLSEAARRLGISRQNLNYKLKKHGLTSAENMEE